MSSIYEQLQTENTLYKYSNFSAASTSTATDQGPNGIDPDNIQNDTFFAPFISYSVFSTQTNFNQKLEYIYFNESSYRSGNDKGYLEFINTSENLNNLLNVDTTITFWYYNDTNNSTDALTVCSWYDSTNNVEVNVQILYNNGNSGSDRQAAVKNFFSVGSVKQVLYTTNYFDVRTSGTKLWNFIAIVIGPGTHKIYIN